MVNTAIYILIRYPLKRLKTRHHMTLNTRENPKWVFWEFLDVLHLLKFHPKKEENLIKKYKKCLVIGCCEKSKGYRLLNFKTNKLVILIDVISDENKTWKVWWWNLFEEVICGSKRRKDETLLTNEIVEDHEIFQVYLTHLRLHYLVLYNKVSGK